ncbi:hypothetical protein [Siphonobacter aquaeclarae]|uniref:hypothetical protein n=1 Tax=Siphonobacter aquaeclarae TaxID=563176 RepID=UPI0015A27384|nr:hypothetical protein [Siphonobacter aquaeclarae]
MEQTAASSFSPSAGQHPIPFIPEIEDQYGPEKQRISSHTETGSNNSIYLE